MTNIEKLVEFINEERARAYRQVPFAFDLLKQADK